MIKLATLLITAFTALPVMADVSTREAEQAAQMVSRWRVAHGLASVKTDASLNRVARIQTEAMMAQGIMSHDAGGDFRARMRNNGVRGTAAENLAAGTSSIDNVINMWQNSSGHNANMLNPEIVRVGMAKGITSSGYVYWTMVLASR